MRRGFGLIGLLVTAVLVVIVGAIAYNIGWSQGLATHVPEGAAGAAPYYYGGWHGGFGFFGIFWFLLFLFGFFWLLRLAFFGRMMRGGGWGGGWGYRGGYPQGMPPQIEERLQEWHKRAHGEQPSGSASPPPPPDQRTV